MAKQVDKSTRQVARLINYLASRDYIGIARSGRANVYVLNYNLIYKNSGYFRKTIGKYIKFPANIVITRKQNPKFFKKLDKFIKQHGHKFVKLEGLTQKHAKPNKDPNRNKHRKLKEYATKAEAIKHNGFYQPSMFKQNKKLVKSNN